MSSAMSARSPVRSLWRQGSFTRLCVTMVLAFGLAGCKSELSTDLDQRQANDIVGALFEQHIPSERVMIKAGRYQVNVDENRLAEAMNVLFKNGLPKRSQNTLCEVMRADSLLQSPAKERAQILCALQEQLATTISALTGVIEAHVHLVLPENDPLRQQLIPSSASVFLRHGANVAMSELLPQVKQLVVNGVAGLSNDKVSVVLDPVQVQERPTSIRAYSSLSYAGFLSMWMHPDSVAPVAWLLYSLSLLTLLLSCAVAYLLWRLGRT